jgi:hypothetical protein
VPNLEALRIQLVANPGAALLVLLVATGLSVYKPQGVTPFGRKRIGLTLAGSAKTAGTPRWVYVVGIIVVGLVLLFVLQHLTSGGFGGHFRHQ